MTRARQNTVIGIMLSCMFPLLVLAQSPVTPGVVTAKSAQPTACVNPTTFALESCGGTGSAGLTDTELRASPVPVVTTIGTPFSCFVNAVTALTECQAAPGAGSRVYVMSFLGANLTNTAQDLSLFYGTGVNCATGLTRLTSDVPMGTNNLSTNGHTLMHSFGSPLIPPLNKAICVRPSVGISFGATLTGFIAP